MTGSAKRGWMPKLRFPEFREAGGVGGEESRIKDRKGGAK